MKGGFRIWILCMSTKTEHTSHTGKMHQVKMQTFSVRISLAFTQDFTYLA